MSDLQEVIDTYFAAWNENDDARRLELLGRAFADGAPRYVDPVADATGIEAISENMATVQQHYPGHTVRRTSDVDVHHDQARFEWDILDPKGMTFLTGVDYADVAEDGRLAKVSGFFGVIAGRDAA
jgi:hypothetical protein